MIQINNNHVLPAPKLNRGNILVYILPVKICVFVFLFIHSFVHVVFLAQEEKSRGPENRSVKKAQQGMLSVLFLSSLFS